MLEEALAITVELRRVLESEVERSRTERETLRSLDSDRIFAGVAARAAFNAEVAELEGRLSGSLARAAGRIGAPEATLARLAERVPAETSALSRVLADVKALAGALAELDRLNLMLAGRALACVQSYLTALHPPLAAYDRRGVRATVGSRGTTWSKV
ncbi:MAG TPA: flagellar export chaperone FlgN [Anaeromyxobacter sp.]|nr:flagellar export chaperone FlgN [Anaeromyxobacter sp.]